MSAGRAVGSPSAIQHVTTRLKDIETALSVNTAGGWVVLRYMSAAIVPGTFSSPDYRIEVEAVNDTFGHTSLNIGTVRFTDQLFCREHPTFHPGLMGYSKDKKVMHTLSNHPLNRLVALPVGTTHLRLTFFHEHTLHRDHACGMAETSVADLRAWRKHAVKQWEDKSPANSKLNQEIAQRNSTIRHISDELAAGNFRTPTEGAALRDQLAVVIRDRDQALQKLNHMAAYHARHAPEDFEIVVEMDKDRAACVAAVICETKEEANKVLTDSQPTLRIPLEDDMKPEHQPATGYPCKLPVSLLPSALHSVKRFAGTKVPAAGPPAKFLPPAPPAEGNSTAEPPPGESNLSPKKQTALPGTQVGAPAQF
eukprot:TRINITY_DN115265_c0_g1_i1.p1 TRINITY_DN115265_c0_g1~~TRINITY_DN115265_c0_g1_i1.p1  ORF type:complete len:366 (-),score=39.57 TRINITY_DN115265_c0_g1_i1:40-1137(-)